MKGENMEYNRNTIDYREHLRRASNPYYLDEKNMEEIYEIPYISSPSIMEGILHTGLYILAGAPKLGKSFLAEQIAYHVATGKPLWEYEVNQGSVLYLALEDTYQDIQQRLYRMFGIETTEKLHFAVCAHKIDTELDKQLTGFINTYEDTKLIIIDTLQKVRKSSGCQYNYAEDYNDISQLKKFADEHNVCLMVVHHTRKQKSEDNFDMILGTNGISGAANGSLLMYADNRIDNNVNLEIIGRNQQSMKLHLNRNQDTLVWELVKTETELWKSPPDPIIESIAQMLTDDNRTWEGTATELAEKVNWESQPNKLSRKLNVNAGRLLNEYSIRYTNNHLHEGRIITLTLEKQ